MHRLFVLNINRGISMSNLIKLSFLIFIFCSNISYASLNSKKNTPDVKERIIFEEIIQDYKEYLATIPQNIRDEIMEYRKKISNLNKQKTLLYQQLTQESQSYLAKEQQFKKKLSLEDKNILK